MLVLTNNCLADTSQDNYKQAQDKAVQAALQQTGAQKVIDDYLKNIDKKFIPPIVNYYGGIMYFTYDTIKNKQVSYKWEF